MELEIPPIYCPIPSRIHPYVDQVERHALEWVDAMGFCEDAATHARVVATKSAEFYGRIAPDAREDRLTTIVKWCYWGFHFDDTRCDGGHLGSDASAFTAVTSQLQRVVETPIARGPDDGPSTMALRCLSKDIFNSATPEQCVRIANAHRTWFSSCAWQIGLRASGVVPDLDTYLTMRLHCAAGMVMTAFLDYANGLPLDPAETVDPTVRALSEAASLIASLDNDIVSYRKEFRGGGADHNLITVLSRDLGLDVHVSVADAVDMRNELMALFLRMQEKIFGSEPSYALRRYAESCGQMIRGNLEWSMNTARYEGSRLMIEMSNDWATRRPRAARTLLPTPSIAWWWGCV